MQPRLLISLLNRMTAKEKNDREIGGKGKVFPSNFLYAGEIFPPRIPVTFTVGLKPLLVKVLLLSNSMSDTNGRGSALTTRAFRPITLRQI